MNLSGKVGSRPRISAPSAPPRPASPEPTAKVAAKIRLTLMPSPRATRGSSTAARSRLPKRVLRQDELQGDDERAADGDDEAAVEADAERRAHRCGPAASVGSWMSCCCEPMHVVDRRDRHEDEADGEQHLVEVAAARRAAGRACARAPAPSSAGDDEGERQASRGTARRSGSSARP